MKIDKDLDPRLSFLIVPVVHWMLFLFFLATGCIYTGGKFSISYQLCRYNNNFLYSLAMVFLFFFGVAFTIYGVCKYKKSMDDSI